LPLHELNQLELQFLLLNDFRLMISVDEMQKYADQLLLNWNPSESEYESEADELEENGENGHRPPLHRQSVSSMTESSEGSTTSKGSDATLTYDGVGEAVKDRDEDMD
jgi:hypothetical protein